MKLLSKRSFFPAYNERDQFYKSLIVKNTLQSSYQCLTEERPGTMDSYQDIVYRELPWGSSPKEVMSKLGAARYKVEKLNDLADHLILFFKKEILNEKAVVQCHFIDNLLYFVHIDFLAALSNDLAHVQELIVKKYLLGDMGTTPASCIKDCYQNKLIIHADVTLGVSYVSGTASIAKIIEKQMRLVTLKKSERHRFHLSEL